MFNNSQFPMVHTSTEQCGIHRFKEYAERLAPGVEAYEKAIFGTAEDKAQFEADMDLRIDEANKWYTKETQAYRATQYNRGQLYNPRNDDRGPGSAYVKSGDTYVLKSSIKKTAKELEREGRGK